MSIAYDASSNSGYQTGSSYSWTHVTGGAERYLVVGVSMLSVAASSVSGITYNGVALSSLGNATSGTGTIRVELWGLANPASGSHTIAVTLSAALDSAAGASSYTGINQGSPTEAFNSASATNVGAADATVNITTVADNDWVVDVVATDDTAITVGSGQTSRTNVTGTLGSGATSSEGPKTPAGAVTMSWTNVAALATWTIAGIALKESGSSSSSSCRSSSSSSSSSSFSCQYTQFSVASACVGFWQMNEALWDGTANEVIDSSGLGNHGVRVADATTTNVNPKLGAACGTFDGTGDYVDCGSGSSLKITGDISIELWFLRADATVSRRLCGNRSSAGSNFGWEVTGNSSNQFGIQYDTGAATHSRFTSSAVTDTTTWHQLVAIRNAGTISIYLDGVLNQGSQSGTGTGDIGTNSANTMIGRSPVSAVLWNGKIDNLRIFNRVITATEVSALYNLGNGTEALSGCFSSSSSSCSSSSSSSCRSSSSSCSSSSSSCRSSSSSSCSSSSSLFSSSSSSCCSSSSCRSSSSCSSSSSSSAIPVGTFGLQLLGAK